MLNQFMMSDGMRQAALDVMDSLRRAKIRIATIKHVPPQAISFHLGAISMQESKVDGLSQVVCWRDYFFEDEVVLRSIAIRHGETECSGFYERWKRKFVLPA